MILRVSCNMNKSSVAVSMQVLLVFLFISSFFGDQIVHFSYLQLGHFLLLRITTCTFFPISVSSNTNEIRY
jgi:ABC-type multidrug transport system permease subunit